MTLGSLERVGQNVLVVLTDILAVFNVMKGGKLG